MNPCGRLSKLRGSMLARLRELDYIINSVRIHPRSISVSFVVIELQSTWSNFVRAYYLSCAYGTRSASGVRIRLAVGRVANEDDAMGLAVKYRNPEARPNRDGKWSRRDEPKWYAGSMVSFLRRQGISNLEKVESAYSLPGNTLVDLIVVRNYFAHRSWQTEAAAQGVARSHGVPGSLSPVDILMSKPHGASRPLVAEWIRTIRTTSEMLCD